MAGNNVPAGIFKGRVAVDVVAINGKLGKGIGSTTLTLRVPQRGVGVADRSHARGMWRGEAEDTPTVRFPSDEPQEAVAL